MKLPFQAAEFDAEVEKLEAHNAVLRQALEEIMRYLKRAGEPGVGIVLLYGICEQVHLPSSGLQQFPR